MAFLRLLITSFVVSCAAFASAPEPLLLAVKDVTAWPNLQQLPDGSCVATIFNKPSHGQTEGHVDCWKSIDGGLSWSLLPPPVLNEPATNRMNVAVGLARNGDLVVICSGWSDKPVAGSERYAKGRFRHAILQPWTSCSSDGGRTWQVNKTAFPLEAPDGGSLIPYGDIKTAENGDLLATAYSARAPKSGNRVYVYRSRDDGRAWGNPVALDDSENCNETALLRLDGQKWLAATRCHGKARGLRLYKSNDDGRTWTFQSQLTNGDLYPAHLMRTNDGRVLLAYGNRSANKGIDIMTSSDGGTTWSEPRRIANFEGDGGYPASIQRKDGRILTLFYAQKTGVYEGYHMAGVIWELDASPKQPNH